MILNQHEPGFVYFTKSVRIPIDKIIGVRHTPNGVGCVIETDRGMTTVLDDYEAVRDLVLCLIKNVNIKGDKLL